MLGLELVEGKPGGGVDGSSPLSRVQWCFWASYSTLGVCEWQNVNVGHSKTQVGNPNSVEQTGYSQGSVNPQTCLFMYPPVGASSEASILHDRLRPWMTVSRFKVTVYGPEEHQSSPSGKWAVPMERSLLPMPAKASWFLTEKWYLRNVEVAWGDPGSGPTIFGEEGQQGWHNLSRSQAGREPLGLHLIQVTYFAVSTIWEQVLLQDQLGHKTLSQGPRLCVLETQWH